MSDTTAPDDGSADEGHAAHHDPDGRSWAKIIGPGVVTGAADDDPSGIGTYSQVGAQFGYSLAWTMVFSYPLLVSIQMICARIGAVTGHGIAHNLRRHYPRPVLMLAVALLLIANTINLGADLGAMAAALNLLVPRYWGIPVFVYVVAFGVVAVVLEVFLSYARYQNILKWTALSLPAYIAVPFVANIRIADVMQGVLVPSFGFGREQTMAVVALLGTTISPYLFFWQTGQEVEEQHRQHTQPSGSSRAGPGRGWRAFATIPCSAWG